MDISRGTDRLIKEEDSYTRSTENICCAIFYSFLRKNTFSI